MSLIEENKKIHGIIVSEGVTIGKVCHYQESSKTQTAVFEILPEQVERHIMRLENALEKSKAEIENMIVEVKNSLGTSETQVFESHIMILNDKGLINKIKNHIEQHNENVEYSVRAVFEEYEEFFSKMEDHYMRDRMIDFKDLKERLLGNLTGDKGDFLCNKNYGCVHGADRIVLTDELVPSLVSNLKNNNVKGIVTKRGGINSHAAIMSRSMEIPYVTGVDIIDNIKCATEVILDADNGDVIFNPTEKQKNDYQIKIENQQKKKNDEIYGPVIKTKKNQEIDLYSNVLTEEDIELTNKHKLKGIGLLRTEFLFYDDDEMPTMEKQTLAYKNIVEKLSDKEITFRLFDFGGDKKIKALKFAEEENPLMGVRGIRYLLKNKNILINQLEALANTAQSKKIKILYPMVSTVGELEEVTAIANDIFSRADVQNNISTGMMFEVPSAFIDSEILLSKVDFGSIGTNDLVQYLYGVDRNNADVLYLYNKNQSSVYALFKMLMKNAKVLNKEISLCGEIGNDREFLKQIIDIGIKKISFNPATIHRVVDLIEGID